VNGITEKDAEEITKAPGKECFTWNTCAETINQFLSLDITVHTKIPKFCKNMNEDDEYETQYILDYYRNTGRLPLNSTKSVETDRCVWDALALNDKNNSTSSGTITKPFRNELFVRQEYIVPRKLKLKSVLEYVIKSISDCHKLGFINYETELHAIIAAAEDTTEADTKFMKGKERLFEKWKALVFTCSKVFL